MPSVFWEDEGTPPEVNNESIEQAMYERADSQIWFRAALGGADNAADIEDEEQAP